MSFKTIDRFGNIQTTYLDNGPRTVGGSAGMGCGPYGCPGGMGAAAPAAQRRTMDRASAVALASGALAGPRAAKYALEVYRLQNAAGMGDVIVSNTPGWGVDSVTGNSVAVDPGFSPGTVLASSSWTDVPAVYGTGGQAPNQTTTTGGGITSQDVGAGISLASLLAGQGISAYQRFTGQPAPVAPQPKQQPSAGLSTGAIVAILAVLAVGIGGAVVLSSRGSRRSAPAAAPTVIRANGKRFVRASGNRYVRSNARVNRYAKLMKKAA
jgi:hypothetical protein